MATRGSEAYDFGLFEPKRRVEQAPVQKNNVIELPRERLEENRRPHLSLWRILPTALSFLVLAGLAGTFIYGQVQLAELTDSLNSVTKQLSEAQSVYTQMEMKSDSQLSLEAVENYATGKLGMEKANPNQVETVKLSGGDKTQVVLPAQEDGWFEKLLGAIRRFLS